MHSSTRRLQTHSSAPSALDTTTTIVAQKRFQARGKSPRGRQSRTHRASSAAKDPKYVGNWPGVTVERKSGTLRGSEDDTVVDLPGIYSLTPYSNEEIVARDFLEQREADVILDASNLERNLYLTTQLVPAFGAADSAVSA